MTVKFEIIFIIF